MKTSSLGFSFFALALTLSACAARVDNFGRQPVRTSQATTPAKTETFFAPDSGPANFQKQKLDCYQVKPSCDYLYSSDPSDTNLHFEIADQRVAFEATLEYAHDQETSTMEIRFTDKTSGNTESKSYVLGDNVTVLGSIENFNSSDGTVYSVLCSGSHLETGSSFKMNAPVSCTRQ